MSRTSSLLLHSGLSYCLWLLILWLCLTVSPEVTLLGVPWDSWIYVHIFHQIWEIFDHVFRYSLCSFLFSSGTPTRYMVFCIMMTHSFLILRSLFLYIFSFVPQTQFQFTDSSPFSNMLWILLVNFVSVIILLTSEILSFFLGFLSLSWYFHFVYTSLKKKQTSSTSPFSSLSIFKAAILKFLSGRSTIRSFSGTFVVDFFPPLNVSLYVLCFCCCWKWDVWI